MEYLLLTILSLGFSYYAAKTRVFAWATMAFIVLGLIIALGSIMTLLITILLRNFNLEINPKIALLLIMIFGYFLTAWLSDKKTKVFVPKNYQKNHLLMIYKVKGSKRIWPTLFGFPRTYKLKFSQSGILTTSEKNFGANYYFSMCKVYNTNGSLYPSNNDIRYFYSTSILHEGFYLDILFLDDSSPANNKTNINSILNEIDFTLFEKKKK